MTIPAIAPLLCTLVVGISAFLLFLVQPLVAKMLLPLYGGASAVWIACSVFFQLALFLGYVLADFLIRRTTPGIQRTTYLALLGLSFLFFPLESVLHHTALTNSWPSLAIVGRLAVTIGVPFITLSMTASLSQHWFLLAGRAEPYRLYAISNLSSFLALLSFPLVLEPSLDLSAHITIWTLLLLVLTAITTLLILLGQASAPNPPRYQDDISLHAGTLSDRVYWLCCSACGVIILLAVTNYLCADIAPIPLLWVAPLALYLATYIISFGTLSMHSGALFLLGYIAAIAAFFFGVAESAVLTAMAALLGAHFFGCALCHFELAQSRPPSQSLSSYYKHVALGGVLGGLFVGILAPLVFDRYYEIVIALTAPLIIRLWGLGRRRHSAHPGRIPLLLFTLLLMGLTIGGRLSASFYSDNTRRSRNFYGTLAVTDYRSANPPYRELSHGSTVHGLQVLTAERSNTPTMYYGRTSGIGLAIESLPEHPRAVAVVGLGAGTLAAYARPGDTFHFIELNPEIIRIAREEFTYLKQSQGRTLVSQADGRLALESFPDHSLDLTLIDAFNGDAIPVHLITKEALELYLRKSAPNGLLVFHISNRYLDLAPVLRSITDTLNLSAALITDFGGGDPLLAPSVYVIATRDPVFFNKPSVRARLTPISSQTRVWTDRYSSLWSVFRRGTSPSLGGAQ